MNSPIQKNEMAYTLRCQGMTNSECASIIGCQTKQVPTLAKSWMNRHSLPHWSESNTVAESSAAYSPEQSVVAENTLAYNAAPKSDTQSDIIRLVEIGTYLESLRDSKDANTVRLIADIARISSGIMRDSKK